MGDTAALRKARGAFFTPAELAGFVAEWAVRGLSDTVLEPSCGEAAFLLPVGTRLQAFGREPLSLGQLQGVEIHSASAAAAQQLLRSHGMEAQVHISDFFDFHLRERVDAVVGNPPYVRYQGFTGEARSKGQRAALAQGVRLAGLASSWAAFVVHASSFLKADGRLGLVLPAELLSVNYAAPVRRFLMERFAKVALVLFEERVFPGVLEEIVLLLAEGAGPTDRCELMQCRDLKDLRSLDGRVWYPRRPEEKWTAALIAPESDALYRELGAREGFSLLLDWGETDLGMVTGNNDYFTLTAAQASARGLRHDELLPICPPSSRHLRGLALTAQGWEAMRGWGSRVYLLHPSAQGPSPAALEYIREGEQQGVPAAYKCRVREPWWLVPLVPAPHLFLTYMNHEAPRLVANQARVRYLNSIHGVTLKSEHRALGSELLPAGALNSLTLLGAELVGRAYGGGLLKLEPKEADKLPVPAPETLREAGPGLRALQAELDEQVSRGRLEEAVRQVDEVVLRQVLGLDRRQIDSLRSARKALLARRMARGGKIERGPGLFD